MTMRAKKKAANLIEIRTATSILDISLPDRVTTLPVPVTTPEPDQTDPVAVIPEPVLADTAPVSTPPSFDYRQTDQVQRRLVERLTDLEAWLALRDKYGQIDNLVVLVNSDLVMVGEPDQQFAYVGEIA